MCTPANGTFADKHQLAVDAASAVMKVEQVPDIPMFRQNTAAFVHDLPGDSLSNAEGGADLCTGAGAHERGRPGPRQAVALVCKLDRYYCCRGATRR